MSRPPKPPLTAAEYEATYSMGLRGGAELVSVMRGAKIANITKAERQRRTVSSWWLRMARLQYKLCEETGGVRIPISRNPSKEDRKMGENPASCDLGDPVPHSERRREGATVICQGCGWRIIDGETVRSLIGYAYHPACFPPELKRRESSPTEAGKVPP